MFETFSSGSAVVRGFTCCFTINIFFFFFFVVQTLLVMCVCGLVFVSEIGFGVQLKKPYPNKFEVNVLSTYSFSFTSVKNELLPSHPLELTEKNVSITSNVAIFTLY